MDQYDMRNKGFVFSSEVPNNYGLSYNSPEGNHVVFYPKVAHSSTSKVLISFDIDDCVEGNFKSLLPFQIEQIYDEQLEPNRKGAPYKSKKAAVKSAVYQMKEDVSQLDNQDELKYIENLLNDFECFADIKFYYKNGEENSEGNPVSDLKISLCTMKEDEWQKISGKFAASVQILPQDDSSLYQESVVFFDLAIRKAPGIIESFMKHTWGHEIGHSLGLGHPSYKSLAHNKKYRSMMEEGSPVELYCLNKHREDPKKMFDCSKAALYPTALDVNSLQHLYGPSKDNSENCVAVRNHFAAEYRKDILENHYQDNGDFLATEEL